MPGTSIENEIITIPDEPSNKRPRLDIDESDKITLSSESVQSLGNSDESGAENMVIEVNVELNHTNDVNSEPTILNESIENGENNSVAINERDKSPKQIETTQESLNETQEQEKVPIHEATTQLDLNTSTETIGDEKLSQEVGYDYPNAGTEQVKVLEVIDNENLPSSNETDELITCGQMVADTEEIDIEKKTESELQLDIPCKVNGIKNGIIENGHISDDIINEATDNNKTSTDNATDTDNANTKVAKNDGVSVEDMLADFVDEVVDIAIEA